MPGTSRSGRRTVTWYGTPQRRSQGVGGATRAEVRSGVVDRPPSPWQPPKRAGLVR
jgi:hypothetical protein